MKLLDMDGFVRVIYKINFISFEGASILAIVIVGFELLIGPMLILGLFIKETLYLTFVLLLAFTGFLAVVLLFDLEVQGCGCFGKISSNHISILDIIRNLVLIGLSLLLIKNRQRCRYFSMDH
jgi:uncharacterized membrane protein YphA (DoxX/SURF4 family)